MKAPPTSSRCIPAARRWARWARWSAAAPVSRLHGQSRPRLHLFHRAVAADGGGGARGAENLRRRGAGARAAAGAGAPCRRPDETQLGLPPSGSQIQPIIVGQDRRAVALAAALQARGYDIRAIRPPTVPEGTARLRIALTLHVDAGRSGRAVRRSGRRNGA